MVVKTVAQRYLIEVGIQHKLYGRNIALSWCTDRDAKQVNSLCLSRCALPLNRQYLLKTHTLSFQADAKHCKENGDVEQGHCSFVLTI